MARAAPILSSFNAGELSPKIEGRVEVAKYGNGCKTLENYLLTVQGPAERRGGTRHIAEVKDSNDRTWLRPFVFSVDQAYQLEFGDGYLRFYTDHGQVQVSGVVAWATATAYAHGALRSSGGVNYYCTVAHTSAAAFATDLAAGRWYALTGTIYEIPTPWTLADLQGDDDTFGLRMVQSNDIVFIVSENYAPRKLSRFSAINWTLTTVTPTGGPFKNQNATSTTAYASAATGVVTLTASSSIFQAAHVGSLFYLGQKSVLSVLQWEPGKAVGAGALRRSDGKNYIALNAATTGGNKPIHTDGAVYDGDSGVQWEFQDPGYGYVLLTGYTSGTVMTGTVVSQIPSNAVGGANASTRWAHAAWSDVEGWPSQVTFFKERLTFGRGQNVWMSVAGDYETFTPRDDGGVITADMAISITLQSDKKNDLLWFAPGDALICGTAGAEFAIKSVTENQPFGPENVTAPEVSARGSRSVVPVDVGDVTLFIQRSGIKLRDFEYDNLSLKFKSFDQNTLADHITQSGLIDISYQQEPNTVIWAVRADGRLVAMTYSREQYESPPFGGWHRHPIGGAFGTGAAVVESISTIPAPAQDRDELWLIVKRTINGVTRRYIEYMDYERRFNDDPQDSFYVDSGLTLDNTIAATLTPGAGADVQYATSVPFTAGSAVFVAGDVGREIHLRYSTLDPADDKTLIWNTAKALITGYNSSTSVDCTINVAFPSLDVIASGGWKLTVTTLSGLDHLEGQEVDVLADGAAHPVRTVTGGSITLQTGASKVQIGLRCRARLQTMRLNAGAQDGTSQGKTARVNKATIRLLDSLGLMFGSSFTDMDEIDFRTALDAMDNVPPLYTGDITVDWPGDYDTNPWLCFEQSQPLPSTIVAVMPIVSVQDRG
jgi:hypothetical protein